ncbi:hypothetical protein [Propionispora vibrioides]|uniref:Peptidase propeptide and YPEB domain-containing protein n=1 Tax=Propionispora vibrioides TaxID=112903 RepID=A0A1H8Y171_9FIRM|nr:hypothetical protein [Propionispora vibrioides]SEP45787.1 hypothetical protein SAMN04490178_13629 [Propionispora vibrioides]
METKISFFEKAKVKAGKGFSAIPVKKVGLTLIICMVIAGAGGVYWHQEKLDEHRRIVQARTRMIEAQAAKNNITLLDQEAVKRIVAEAIGVDGSQIEYKQIELTTKDNEQYMEKRSEHSKGYEKLMMNDKFTWKPLAMEMGPIVATTAKVDNPVASYPFYKVTCKANGIKYRLQVDAVTGRVLTSKVNGD